MAAHDLLSVLGPRSQKTQVTAGEDRGAPVISAKRAGLAEGGSTGGRD